MKLEQIISGLTEYQAWRRGADTPQPEPKQLGKLIDAAIRALKMRRRAKK